MLLASNFQNQFIFTLANISRHQNERTSQTVLLRFSGAKKSCFQVPVVFSHPKLKWRYKLSLQEFWKVGSTRNKFAVVFLFYSLHSFPSSMELLGSVIPIVTELTFNISTLEIIYGFLTPRTVQ